MDIFGDEWRKLWQATKPSIMAITVDRHLPVKIKITRVDGVSVEYDDLLYQSPDYDGVFIWEAGNFSCDCNRALFFGRALNGEELDEKCGHGRYRVDYIKDETGKIWYSEKS